MRSSVTSLLCSSAVLNSTDPAYAIEWSMIDGVIGFRRSTSKWRTAGQDGHHADAVQVASAFTRERAVLAVSFTGETQPTSGMSRLKR